VASGELSPWAAGSPGSAPDPYAGSYTGPWGPDPGTGPYWSPAAPSAHPGVSDEQLRRLPPPLAGGPPPRPAPGFGDQRPAVIGLGVTLAVTASLLWVCGLSLFLLVAVAGTQAMSPIGEDGYVFHVLDEAVLRMGDGLWLPLYGFPVASLVTGFLLLARRPWARVAHSVVGVVSLGWAGWWLRDSLLSWVVVVLYVGTAVVVLWVPAVGRWYAGRPRPPRPDRQAFEGAPSS
jgi:hypothetical protein